MTDKYLGLPSHVGVDRGNCFRHLLDRVWALIDVWNERMLSLGGKEVLLKSIA